LTRNSTASDKRFEWILDAQVRQRREKSFVTLEAGRSRIDTMFGPPGTGRHHGQSSCGTISKRGKNTCFLKIESYEIVSKWLGESAKNVKEVFSLPGNSAPSILFIDEADAIGRARMEATTDADETCR